MHLSAALTLYLARLFLLRFAWVILAFAAVVLLFDAVELFRRTAANPLATFDTVAAMSLVKLPDTIGRTLPFAVLVSTILALRRLNRHHELEVTRASGVSVWQLLLPLAGGGFAIGVAALAALSPAASTLYAKYQAMEAEYVGGRPTLAAVAGKGVWFRQSTRDGHYFLHAREFVPANAGLRGIMVLMMQEGDRFTLRIDADRARLGLGYWVLFGATLHGPDAQRREVPVHRLETELTIENIQESFAHPATLSFWALPGFVRVLEAAGFPAVRHRLHWQTQLALPVLLAAIVLAAATFCLRPARRGDAGVLIAVGLACAMALFFMMDVVSALGAASRIPIWLAAWSPAVVAALLGSAVLFHLEDG